MGVPYRKSILIGFSFILLGIPYLIYQTQTSTDKYYFYYRFLPKILPAYLPIEDSPEIKFQQSPLTLQNYQVKKGDSLWNLAKKFGLNIDTIVSYNSPPKVHLIPLGQDIKIPSIDGLVYKRLAEETIDQIAAKYKIEKEKIIFFNPNFETAKEIFIPGAYYNLDERMGQLGTEFLKPVQIVVITDRYGFRIHPITKKRSFHKGIDLGGPIGTKIYASKGGTVTFAGNYKNYGNLVVIKHKKGYLSRYAHLHSISVKAGQKISSQMIIGTLGKTGRVTGPHLHFEIWKNNQSINPRDVTDFN